MKNWTLNKPAALACGLGLLALVNTNPLQGAAKPPEDPLEISLTLLGTYPPPGPLRLTGAAEIVAHDRTTQRLFVANAVKSYVDALDIQDPANPTLVGSLDLSGLGGSVNSVACMNGIVAVAVEASPKTSPGWVVFTDAALNPNVVVVQVGSLPDMVTFTPDGTKVLVANEGEPASYIPPVDPEGSISIIDISGGVANATVSTATFTAFNGVALDPSIRIYGPGATVAQDLEPEYIAVSKDSKTAWVTLQENNAIAIVDIDSATVLALAGLGFKDHSAVGNELDASDRDGKINIVNWPVKGMYMPDGIAAYEFKGKTYLVMANEGDSRADWPGYNEETRVGSVTLDPTCFPNGADLKKNANLGRLRITKANGDTDGDGDYDELYSFGARSFSIRTATGDLVFDSGSDFERLIAEVSPAYFNCSHDTNIFDARSATKGPEPEGIALGKAYGRMLAFIGFERIGGVAVYDIGDPDQPTFVDYFNNRDFTNPSISDLGPEGLHFISVEDSPTGKPLLAVTHEISGTTTIYEVSKRNVNK